MFFNTITTATTANTRPNWREILTARREMEVEVEGVGKVRPSRDEAIAMLRDGKPVAVTDEAIAAAKVAAEVTALKMERFHRFCDEDGIDGNGERMNPRTGIIEVYAPDAMGYPTHVLDKCPETGEYL
jgi:hypothetical protein